MILQNRRLKIAAWCVAALLCAVALVAGQFSGTRQAVPAQREEVVFWHFWGGADRDVVESVVQRFNESQKRYWVRPIAMPGNNLDLKLFLAVTGGDPPDVINQDDPIMADWAARGALTPLREITAADDIERLQSYLFPAARRLSIYNDQMYAVCNGLDIRALYYNRSMLQEHGLTAPRTLADLDRIAETIAPPITSPGAPVYERYGYLPDPRRLWAWGTVFGGDFYDASQHEATLTDPQIVAALEWMTSYRQRYGADALAAFRQGDQALPGSTFPLLARRYAVIMDGQWRVRDLRAWQAAERKAGREVDRFGVAPLPPPPGGVADAGWVNGNFFLVPRGADQPQGAWEFIKFWIGFDGHQQQAAQTCIAGGWIPVSPEVVETPAFQQYLKQEPLFAEFVRLAGSPHQEPTPITPGAPLFYREVVNAAETALYAAGDAEALAPQHLLSVAEKRVQAHLDRVRRDATDLRE